MPKMSCNEVTQKCCITYVCTLWFQFCVILRNYMFRLISYTAPSLCATVMFTQFVPKEVELKESDHVFFKFLGTGWNRRRVSLWRITLCLSAFVTQAGCREDHKSRPLDPSFHLLSQRVKGKGTGLMKRSYAAHFVFKGPLVCVHVSL